MKPILVIAILVLCSCGRESSPEGRMQIKAEQLQADIDSLKLQNKAVLDSISNIRRELKELKGETN